MSIVEKLMKIDAGLLSKNKGTLKMKLKRIGEEVEFECVEVDSEKATNLDEEALNIQLSGGIGIATFNTKIKLILLGCSLFSNKELQEHFNCTDSKDLIKKLLTKSEIEKLADFIANLGGLADSEDLIDEVKN
ncbi:phage tail assembly chaperone [Peptostreptococcus sp. D1]|uniref:phage tail assembly chaperone n=1 Tax=Peptostreptococcus sp. D1 TaxID=72304 RepID=UPI0008E7A350|nr:hypothetical protein [Peptostreptococcus sp. D1]SFE87819.1 Phage XkdN-like tail assembly chaperone protein, TAC [Peptostreptococcus sp. D1]